MRATVASVALGLLLMCTVYASLSITNSRSLLWIVLNTVLYVFGMFIVLRLLI